MAEVVQEAQREFWQSPTTSEGAVEAPLPAAVQKLGDACADCGGEFMIGARFCHACGLARPKFVAGYADSGTLAGLWKRTTAFGRECVSLVAASWEKTSFPQWLRYLHFHEIKRWVGLPTAPFVAFMIGLGCVAGAVGVGFIYHASNLAEFQAIQMWRMEWLLAATAAFVAGVLLKKPSDNSNND